jgi:tetratricopeptide (TPR) repeat protein
MAAALAPADAPGRLAESDPAGSAPSRSSRVRRALAWSAAALALLACTVVLAFPYWSVRKVSQASDVRQRNPGAALRDLATAADLNPLNPDPGRIAGTIALQSGQFAEAQKRFRQATAREPGGWFGWLGAGLAASSLGDRATAKADFKRAASINSTQPTIQRALDRVNSSDPLAAADALAMLAATE